MDRPTAPAAVSTGRTEMTASISDRIRSGASTAAQISALCHFLAEALGSDPETCLASQAIEGLKGIADNLTASLHAIAEETTRR